MKRPEQGVVARVWGESFRWVTSPGLFSADKLDAGTRLLLDNLPSSAPSRVLDLGCGYGGLGLPIATRHRQAHCVWVDRNCLAVECARKNAEAHGLPNVEAFASLGFREVGVARFDWIVSNIPARIGERGVEYFLEEGGKRLCPGGELRAVVIRDLEPLLERLAVERAWPLRRCARGEGHAVYALPSLPGEPGTDHESIYVRDCVRIGRLELERPSDVSDDAQHQRDAIELLIDLLPKKAPKTALVWRCGFGAVAIELAQRGVFTVAADTDLLATTFSRRNAARLNAKVETRDAFELTAALRPGEMFDFFAGEIHPESGPKAIEAEIAAAKGCVRRGGSVLWLGLTRQSRKHFKESPLASRGSYSVWQMGPSDSTSTIT